MINFFKQTFSAVRWIFSILKTYIRVRPATTLTVVGLSVLSRVTNVLAFLMPLKVILLAGSDGVPRYFRFFISPEEKADWILGLAIAAVVSYVLTLVFDELSARLSESGSAGVLEGANKLALVGKQRDQARSNYSKITQLFAAGLFALVSLMALVYFNPLLVAVFFALLFIELLFTSIAMRGGSKVRRGKVQTFIKENLSEYLNILSSVNFLASFFFILVPFLSGHGNILVAILSFLLIRRMLPALKSVIGGIASLYEERHLIDPLVFRKRKLQKKESNESQIVRTFFDKTSRQVLAEKQMASILPKPGKVEVHWQDSAINGVYTFAVTCELPGEGQAEYFQQQVFPAKQAHLLGREDLLFSMVKRRQLNAPAVVARFQEGSFECQFCEYGTGRPLPANRYSAVIEKLITDLWCFKPPRKLVAAFNTARATLPGRLTAELIERLAVAVDSDAESAALEALRAKLPEIRERLERLPVYVTNPDIVKANVIEFGAGDIRVMTWARWAIEPIGAGIPQGLRRDKLPGILEQVNAQRRDLEFEVTLKDIELVELCRNIEPAINRGKYKAALKTAARVVDCWSQ